MMDVTTASRTEPRSEHVVAPAARLTLEPTLSGRGMLDGGWWPRSDDPLAELPPLIAALDTRVGTVFRVALNRGTWTGTPRKITVGGRVVRLGWSGPDDVHAMSVSGAGRDSLDLLVVPPRATSASAWAAMATAADSGSPAGASAILAAHRITGDPSAGRAAS